eukprot:1159454-Pelagomonas_calceolata.AAC.1
MPSHGFSVLTSQRPHGLYNVKHNDLMTCGALTSLTCEELRNAPLQVYFYLLLFYARQEQLCNPFLPSQTLAGNPGKPQNFDLKF